MTAVRQGLFRLNMLVYVSSLMAVRPGGVVLARQHLSGRDVLVLVRDFS